MPAQQRHACYPCLGDCLPTSTLPRVSLPRSGSRPGGRGLEPPQRPCPALRRGCSAGLTGARAELSGARGLYHGEQLGRVGLQVMLDMDEQLVKRVRKLGIVRPHRREFLEEALDGAPFPATRGLEGVSPGRRRGLVRLIEDIGFQVGMDAKFQYDLVRDSPLDVRRVAGIIVRNEVLDTPVIRP